MANALSSSSFQQQVDTPSDEDVQEAISKFLARGKWGIKSCFGFPEEQPQFWIKFATKCESERIMIEARNMQHAHKAIESFYEKDSSRRQKVLESTYKEQCSPRSPPPRVRIPELFRIVETKEHIALLMEFINGETLDRRMRVQFSATHSPLGWKPNPYRHDLSSVENDLHAFADAIGVVLAVVPEPPDARPGPAGGGSPNLLIFIDEESACKNGLPYEFTSMVHLTNEVNKAARLGGSTEDVNFLDDRLYYILSDLNNGNVMFTKDGEIYIIDHYNGGFYPLCFMTFVAHQAHTVSSYLLSRLQLPDHNLDILERAASNFCLPEEETEEPTDSEEEGWCSSSAREAPPTSQKQRGAHC